MIIKEGGGVEKMKLKGKSAVVTGGGRGVGRAISVAFAKEGANVVVNYVSNDRAANETVEMVKKVGGNGLAVKADVATMEGAQEVIDSCVKKFGRIDILVNNAGFTRPAMLLKMTEKQWDEVVDCHLKGPFLCTQAAARYMVEQKYGKIIK